MRRFLHLLVIAMVSATLLAAAGPADAQLGKLKDKVKKKAEEKVDKKVDQTLDGSKEQPAEGDQAEEPAEGEDSAKVEAKGSSAAEDMTLYTKYDFIPGDKVIFYDDLSREEMGEFPSRWALENGVFEIVKQHGQAWIWCSDRGMIYPKVPVGPLPQKYTFELDFYANQKDDGWLGIFWFDAEQRELGRLYLSYDKHTELTIGSKRLSDKEIERLPVGKHTLRVMATKTTMKCYIDQQRIANVPAVEGFDPVRIGVSVDPYFSDHDPMLTGACRYAEGGKTMKEQLDEEGRIVTHGILFDSGSDKIKAESYKTLADIGGLLTDNPELRISIEGHTDSDGADAANQSLSDKRAASVRTYLMDVYKIDGTRLESKGWGESKPLDTNDTPEGKANNRRVELVKL